MKNIEFQKIKDPTATLMSDPDYMKYIHAPGMPVSGLTSGKTVCGCWYDTYECSDTDQVITCPPCIEHIEYYRQFQPGKDYQEGRDEY